MVTDPVSDLIVRIKNANDAGKESLTISYSKMKEAIANVLSEQGFVKEVNAPKGKKVQKTLEIGLVYENGKGKVQGIQRISKLSKRVYQGVKDLKPVRNGFGSLILSTPKGILTDKQAQKEKVGGEALFKIW
jgi:small subunit ribosomal protein S8